MSTSRTARNPRGPRRSKATHQGIRDFASASRNLSGPKVGALAFSLSGKTLLLSSGFSINAYDSETRVCAGFCFSLFRRAALVKCGHNCSLKPLNWAIVHEPLRGGSNSPSSISLSHHLALVSARQANIQNVA